MSRMMYELPAASPEGRARASALANAKRVEVTPTSLVNYLSRGRLLVIGDESLALGAARRAAAPLERTICVPSEATTPAVSSQDGMTVIRGGVPSLEGSLGSYRLGLSVGGEPISLAELLGDTDPDFDLVLDLGGQPLLTAELLPPGYLAPGSDPEALEAAIDALPELTGEFEKPKYFNYNLDICAHGASGLEGCRRCIDACPAEAIISLGDKVEVNPQLCQGGGSCVAACPTGAMTYAYPSVRDLLRHVRAVLDAYRSAGGDAPLVMFHDASSAAQLVDQLAAVMPERVLPIEVEEIGSVGMDAWFACLAYGAAGVVLLGSSATPSRVNAELDRQIGYARPILEGLGLSAQAIQRLDADADDAASNGLATAPDSSAARPARFEAPDEKRTILKFSIDHLHGQATTGKRSVALPAGAPFGGIKVDKKACTLCMSCVGVCPASAVRDGQGLPQLNFHEWSCVQCGLCEAACPEDAISLNPRFLYDTRQREQQRTLHEEEPFCCISCGKPFATQSMLKVMTKKLETHWMFQSEEAVRRLKMCDHCRVKDMMRSGGLQGSSKPN
ncbi:MAG: 4Fe-4S binding protein [Gammaproteobacteria bacterium]